MNKGILISKNVFIEKKNLIMQENFCGGLISWNYYLNRWKKVQIWKKAKFENAKQQFLYQLRLQPQKV